MLRVLLRRWCFWEVASSGTVGTATGLRTARRMGGVIRGSGEYSWMASHHPESARQYLESGLHILSAAPRHTTIDPAAGTAAFIGRGYCWLSAGIVPISIPDPLAGLSPATGVPDTDYPHTQIMIIRIWLSVKASPVAICIKITY